MNTYSHFLITAAAHSGLTQRRVPVRTKWFLLGSLLPDLPLVLLTLSYMAYRRWITPLPPGEHIFGTTFDQLYFQNPFWITAHSLFHAPPTILLIALLGYYYATRRDKSWGHALFWFAAGCGLHSLVDILTHYDDGPVLFFPFHWHYRFSSPISYWDPRHYGRIVAPLEHLLDLIIIFYLLIQWLRRRWAPHDAPIHPPPS